jgi:hypothetical protein
MPTSMHICAVESCQSIGWVHKEIVSFNAVIIIASLIPSGSETIPLRVLNLIWPVAPSLSVFWCPRWPGLHVYEVKGSCRYLEKYGILFWGRGLLHTFPSWWNNYSIRNPVLVLDLQYTFGVLDAIHRSKGDVIIRIYFTLMSSLLTYTVDPSTSWEGTAYNPLNHTPAILSKKVRQDSHREDIHACIHSINYIILYTLRYITLCYITVHYITCIHTYISPWYSHFLAPLFVAEILVNLHCS